MKIIVTDSPSAAAAEAYAIVEAIVKNVKNPVLGLATGSTPLGLYALMVEGCKKGVSYKNVRTVNLDEYVGLAAADSQSYAAFMNENLFDRIDINKENTHLPSGTAADLLAEAARYSALIAQMPQDVQILGIGSNGHIGFNEPAQKFVASTNIVTLKESTRQDNARFFASLSDVPTHAITMGVGDIMNAKAVIIMAFGESKANAVRAMLCGDIDPQCPASILQLHKNVTLILDKPAASC